MIEKTGGGSVSSKRQGTVLCPDNFLHKGHKAEVRKAVVNGGERQTGVKKKSYNKE